MLHRNGAWEVQAGYAYAAVGICSLAAYPIGAILLEKKCGWSCVPTVSDVERPLAYSNEVSAADVVRRALISLAVLLRIVLVPTILIQVFSLLRLKMKPAMLYVVKTFFYIFLAVWIVSDFFQAVVGNDLKHRADYTPHTIAIHIDITALIIFHIVLLVSLSTDAENRGRWLAAASVALMKLTGAALFLAVRLSTTSVVWQFVEWAMLMAMGGLQVSVGLALPAGMKLNARSLKVSRTQKNPGLLMGAGYDSLRQT